MEAPEEVMEEGEASNEEVKEVEAPKKECGGGGGEAEAEVPEQAGFGMEDTLGHFQLTQVDEAAE